MRCHEAKLRLNQPESGKTADNFDQQLLDHLASCSDCAREASALGMLDQILKSVSADDPQHVIPFDDQKQIILSRLADTRAKNRRLEGRSVTGRRRLSHRPAYVAGLVAAAAMVVIVSLVPFGYYRTVGYDVALAGINMELALDDDRVCKMLTDVGLLEAVVDVTGCDTVCNLLVYDLKSAEEVQLVVSAFDSYSNTQVTPDVIPIVTRTSGTLIDRAQQNHPAGKYREVSSEDET